MPEHEHEHTGQPWPGAPVDVTPEPDADDDEPTGETPILGYGTEPESEADPTDDGIPWPPPADDPTEEPSEEMAKGDRPDPDVSQTEP